MSRATFRARCTRSRDPQVLLVTSTGPDKREERYYALKPEEAVVLAGELMESARQAYRVGATPAGSVANRQRPTMAAVPPIRLKADFCRHTPSHCPLPVCLCRPYPISAERVQMLYDLRKLVASFSFRSFWIATVSESEAEVPTAAGSPSPARPGPALPVEGR